MTSLPDFIYGTAWKENRTAALTELAIRNGFRAIDTANQRKHYFEAGVGEALAAAYRAGVVTRDDLFLQTIVFRTIPRPTCRCRLRNRSRVRCSILGPIASTASSCTGPLRATVGPSTTTRSGTACFANEMPAGRVSSA